MRGPFAGVFEFRGRHQGGPGMFNRGWGGRRLGRVFEKGDLKYVILDLLKEKPRHGYEIIRALEERFSGFYTPSPGAVYPTLQLLEDLGQATATQQDGKKTYAITDAGRQFLAERENVMEALRDRFRHTWGGRPDAETAASWSSIKHELGQLGELGRMFAKHGASDPEKLRQIAEVLRRGRVEIEVILRSEGPVSQ
ncbi:MAG: PadR family transcriptional regulator [Dehalococcoidia bacterium]